MTTIIQYIYIFEVRMRTELCLKLVVGFSFLVGASADATRPIKPYTPADYRDICEHIAMQFF